MIAILLKIHKDEILYSILGRYHLISGNKALKDTLEAIFGDKSVVATLEFPCHLDHFASQIQCNNEIDSDYLISKTTLFPLYAPFLPIDKKIGILEDMKFGHGNGIKYKVGFIAGGICKKPEIFYCPLCAKEEITEFGEAYIHRLHQVQGIQVCHKHLCMLVPYGSKHTRSRLEFISISEDLIVKECDFRIDESHLSWQLEVCHFAEYMLNNDLSYFNQALINERYLQLLKKEGYLTARGTIKQAELVEAFKLFYGEKFLDIMESNIDVSNDYSWLQQITRKPKSVVHPIRHILFMRFLCSDPAVFFSNKKRESINPFGDGPWPCLNICCKNYKKPVIKQCIVSADYKTREPVGTFECKCGFTYSRKAKEDEFTIGRVKEFGNVWERELRMLIDNRSYTLRYMARMLNCDPKTVVRYADKLMLKHELNSTMDISYNNKIMPIRKYPNTGTEYKKAILNFVRTSHDITRQEIRKSMYKQYSWLYRNEKEWLYSNIPLQAKQSKSNIRVDWGARDNEICEMLKTECGKLMQSDKPIRITGSLLSRRIGKQELIEKWLDKLPQAKQLIEDLVETVEQFQLRRVDAICKVLLQRGKKLTRWYIVRLAGLKDEISHSVNERIEQYINHN